VESEVPRASRVDDELRDVVLGAFEPLADNLVDIGKAGTVRPQDIRVVVFGNGRAVAPGGLAVLESRLEARDVNRKLFGAGEVEGRVLLVVDMEVEATFGGGVVGDVKVHGGPLLSARRGLWVSVCRLEKCYRGGSAWDTYIVGNPGVVRSRKCCVGFPAPQWKEEMGELRVDERRKGRNTKEHREKGENVHVECSWISVVDVECWSCAAGIWGFAIDVLILISSSTGDRGVTVGR
jgi:hypothetical protein